MPSNSSESCLRICSCSFDSDKVCDHRLTVGHSVGAAPDNHWGSIEKTAVNVLLLFLLFVLVVVLWLVVALVAIIVTATG